MTYFENLPIFCVGDDYYQIQRLLLAEWAEFAASCCLLEAKPLARYFVDFCLAFLQTEFLGEFQKLFVTSFLSKT